jgi:hypothetical protein
VDRSHEMNSPLEPTARPNHTLRGKRRQRLEKGRKHEKGKSCSHLAPRLAFGWGNSRYLIPQIAEISCPLEHRKSLPPKASCMFDRPKHQETLSWR